MNMRKSAWGDVTSLAYPLALLLYTALANILVLIDSYKGVYLSSVYFNSKVVLFSCMRLRQLFISPKTGPTKSKCFPGTDNLMATHNVKTQPDRPTQHHLNNFVCHSNHV